MSAAERLLPVFDAWQRAYGVIHAGAEGPHEVPDPHLAQDIEDGAAIRRLQEAPGTWQISNVRTAGATVGYAAEAWAYSTGRLVKVLGHDDPDMMPPTFPTLAAAADACREAIEAQR